MSVDVLSQIVVANAEIATVGLAITSITTEPTCVWLQPAGSLLVTSTKSTVCAPDAKPATVNTAVPVASKFCV